MSKGYGDFSKSSYLTDDEQNQSVVITDPALPDNPMIFISDEFVHQTGYSPEESLGKNCRFLQGPETDQNTVAAIREALASESEITVDILNYRKDGAKFWNRLRIRPLCDDGGNLLFYAGAQNPISESDVRANPIVGVQN